MKTKTVASLIKNELKLGSFGELHISAGRYCTSGLGFNSAFDGSRVSKEKALLVLQEIGGLRGFEALNITTDIQAIADMQEPEGLEWILIKHREDKNKGVLWIRGDVKKEDF